MAENLSSLDTCDTFPKLLLHHAGDGTLVSELTEMRALSERLFGGADAAEGMRAFAERRTPSWALEP